MALQDASVIDEASLLAYLDKENGTYEAVDPGENSGEDVAAATLMRPRKEQATYKALHPATGKPIKDRPYEEKVALASERAAVRAENWEPEVRADATSSLKELTDVQVIQRLINMTDAEREIWLEEVRKDKHLDQALILGVFGEKPEAVEAEVQE